MNRLSASSPSSSSCCPFVYVLRYELVSLLLILCFCPGYCAENQAFAEAPFLSFFDHCHSFCHCQVKSSHLYLYSAFNNTDCVKALNSIKLEDRVSVMYNNKIKHSIFS